MPIARIGDINIHYDTRGEGEPLLNGYRGSGLMWGEELIALLSRSFQVIYFDNRGTGLSDKPDTLYTIPIMADDAAGLLRHLGIRQAYVFGVSMGGMIAQELVLCSRRWSDDSSWACSVVVRRGKPGYYWCLTLSTTCRWKRPCVGNGR